MAEFPLYSPTDAERADALRALAQIQQLGRSGVLTLPPYLVKLLIQLAEILGAVRLAPTPRPRDGFTQKGSRARLRPTSTRGLRSPPP